MVKIITSNNIAKAIVQKAFIRSHGNIISHNDMNIYCFISPNKENENEIQKLILTDSKILIFGKVSASLAKTIGLELDVNTIKLNDITFDHENTEDSSEYIIKYDLSHELCKRNTLEHRYFYRFDFTDEWNNFGYGPVTTNDDVWSMCNSLKNINTTVLASVYKNEKNESVFMSLKDFENASILFINREVGTIDGLDWSVVEDFLSLYRITDLPALPLICDTPNGYEAIASSRLDCDQSIINAKPLVELYKKHNIDISLAISTGINIDTNDIKFLNTFYDDGGGVLSHTINHYEYWGETYDIAYDEAIGSKKWLEENIKNLKELTYAVCPFHSNKPYSIQALSDAGYKGFISGIIHNDPEYLVSTSGEVPFIDKFIVTHSQQCMLHGDCYHRNKNSLDIYKQSFKNHYKSKRLFGYLDHPFGEYDYGWGSEEERLNVHEEYIHYINSFENVKWLTVPQILDFVIDKSDLEIEITEANKILCKRKSFNSSEKIKVMYKNKAYIC